MKKISYAGYRFLPEIIHSNMALSPVQPQPARRRRFVGGTRLGGAPRDGSALGEPFRTDDRGRPADASLGAHTTWHLDEVYLKIEGRMVYLWRAVDAEGKVLDVLDQSKRNAHAALKLMRKLLKKYAFVSDRLVTDDLVIIRRRGPRPWDRTPA